MQHTLYTIQDAANNLGISIDLVEKFIQKGLVLPLHGDKSPRLTAYNFRRLREIVNLYEHSYSLDNIENILNN